MKNSILKTGLLAATFLIGGNVQAQNPPQAIADSLQYILDNSLPSTYAQSGAVMSVHVPGKWTWNGSAGNGISGNTVGQVITTATPTTKFRVGSITKTMVATCIMLLEEQGLIGLQDPIINHLRPTMVNDTIQSSDTVRVLHLLNHTSGIANAADNMTCQQDVLANPLNSHSLEEAVYCGASQGEVFPPGFVWGYSNTNYTLLAMIIENLTGMSYEAYLTQEIITPLGLTNTEVPTTNQINGDHMGCYWNIGQWIDLTIINPTTYTGWADVVSNTEDLLTFYKALRDGNIVTQASLTKMMTIDPASYDYGLGLDFYQVGGDWYFGHYGEVANSSAMMYADVQTIVAPNGYYISYNFNVQGVDMGNVIDVPVYDLLHNDALSTNELEVVKEYSIYPNPSKDVFFLSGDLSQQVICKVYDLSGKLVQTEVLGQGQNKLNCDNLAKGVYTLAIVSENKIETHKLILE